MPRWGRPFHYSGGPDLERHVTRCNPPPALPWNRAPFCTGRGKAISPIVSTHLFAAVALNRAALNRIHHCISRSINFPVFCFQRCFSDLALRFVVYVLGSDGRRGCAKPISASWNSRSAMKYALFFIYVRQKKMREAVCRPFSNPEPP